MEKKSGSYGLAVEQQALFPSSGRVHTEHPKGELFQAPEDVVPTFNRVQQIVSLYHEDFKTDPQKASIRISNERYILIRAKALAADFLNTLRNFYADKGEQEAWNISRNLLFDLAHVIGINDAKAFHKRMGITDPLEKISIGPIHFAYTGCAIVEKAADFTPMQEDFFFRFDHHYSFEAEDWIERGEKSEYPVCIFGSGYSSGWCEESYGRPLTTVELTCRAQGHEHCSFVMAPPDRIEECIKKYLPNFKFVPQEKFKYEIPTLFERKKIEEELKRSNEELEQFAYVASHDLQEPLRMISGYVQLINKRYHEKLDQDATEFLQFALDGVQRMQRLINDLLEYSRVGRKGTDIEKINLEELYLKVLQNLKVAIEESKAEISHDPFPIVFYPERELYQLFQNLIGNAIKFHGDKPPKIHIGVRQDGKQWVFSVEDNGIGIDPKYADRIFVIFQRLHTRQEYPGTGIGLAICKKIVERHGGKIWFESTPNQGTSFFFTIPLRIEMVRG